MKTTELKQKLTRLERRHAKVSRAIERTKTEIDEAEKLEELKSNLVIEIAGLRFAKVNLGTDLDNPCGKYYTWEEANEACPKGWRLPTKEEHEQLVARTTQQIITRDGARGMLFSDKETGAEMFLPAAGHRNRPNAIFNYIGYLARYWSSSVPATAYYAYFLGFDYSGIVIPSYNFYRSYGFSVRCIEE